MTPNEITKLRALAAAAPMLFLGEWAGASTDFYSAARSTVPALLDEVERLTKERGEILTMADRDTILLVEARDRALAAEARVAEVDALLGEAVGALREIGQRPPAEECDPDCLCNAARARTVLAKIGAKP